MPNFFIIPPSLRAPHQRPNHNSTRLFLIVISAPHTHRLASPPPIRHSPPRKMLATTSPLAIPSSPPPWHPPCRCQKRENSVVHEERRATIRHYEWQTIPTAMTTAKTGLFVISVLVPFLPICNLILDFVTLDFWFCDFQPGGPILWILIVVAATINRCSPFNFPPISIS